MNAVATPRANGQVERYNSTALTSLMTTAMDDERWDQEVPKIQFAINNTVSSATGRTPSELFFGYRPRAPTDAQLTTAIQEERPTISNLEQVRKEVAEKIAEDQRKQKERYDRKRKAAKNYKQGDQVVIAMQPKADGTSKKLRPRFQGPFTIVKCLENDRYVVKEEQESHRSNRKKYDNVIAADRIKPWIPPGGVSDSSESGSDEYQGNQIEPFLYLGILGTRITSGWSSC